MKLSYNKLPPHAYGVHLRTDEVEHFAEDLKIRHLAACQSCQTRVRRYAEALDKIPMAAYFKN